MALAYSVSIALLTIALGLLYVNTLEWTIHKYLLHGLGRKKNSIFHFHIVHHKNALGDNFKDTDVSWHELIGLVLIVLAHSWLYFVLPWFFLGAVIGGLGYYIVHRWTHYRPELAKRYSPWHYTHHMKWPKYNWCVTLPITDLIMGTYKDGNVNDVEAAQIDNNPDDSF